MYRCFRSESSEDEDQEIELYPINVYRVPPVGTPPSSGSRENHGFAVESPPQTPTTNNTPPIPVTFSSSESHLGRNCSRFWMAAGVVLFFFALSMFVFVAFWWPEKLPGNMARRIDRSRYQ